MRYEVYSKIGNEWKFMARKVISGERSLLTLEEGHERINDILTYRYIRYWCIVGVAYNNMLPMTIPLQDMDHLSSSVDSSMYYLEIEPTPEIMMRKLRA